MNKQLVIIGASGHGKVVADVAEKMKSYDKIFFLDDNDQVRNCGKYSVVGKCDEVDKFIPCSDIFVAIGNANTRRRILEKIKNLGANIPLIIHPQAVIGQNVQIGVGTVLMAGSIINSDAKIGQGCIINTCASVDHDCTLGDYVHVSAGAHLAGSVTIGNETWVGIGGIISNNIRICDGCMIGAGAVVVKDILECATYVGVPAKKTDI